MDSAGRERAAPLERRMRGADGRRKRAADREVDELDGVDYRSEVALAGQGGVELQEAAGVACGYYLGIERAIDRRALRSPRERWRRRAALNCRCLREPQQMALSGDFGELS